MDIMDIGIHFECPGFTELCCSFPEFDLINAQNVEKSIAKIVSSFVLEVFPKTFKVFLNPLELFFSAILTFLCLLKLSQ